MSRFLRPLLLMGLALLGGSVTAASAQSCPEGLRKCAGESDPERRLACFDAALAAAPAAPKAAPAPTRAAVAPPEAPKAAPAPPTTAAVTPPTATAVTPPTADFGVRNGPLDVHKFSAEAHEMSAAVTVVERRANDLLVITLDNGQSWMENQPSAYFPLKAGDTVQIRSAAMGSYMLYVPSTKRFTHVTRIR